MTPPFLKGPAFGPSVASGFLLARLL